MNAWPQKFSVCGCAHAGLALGCAAAAALPPPSALAADINIVADQPGFGKVCFANLQGITVAFSSMHGCFSGDLPPGCVAYTAPCPPVQVAAAPNTIVMVHYVGYIDGTDTVFDSTRGGLVGHPEAFVPICFCACVPLEGVAGGACMHA